jgi:hypothetical protein
MSDKLVAVTVRLHEHQFDALAREAAQDERSISWTLRRMIERNCAEAGGADL